MRKMKMIILRIMKNNIEYSCLKNDMKSKEKNET